VIGAEQRWKVFLVRALSDCVWAAKSMMMG
jgi:hypothetical protein